MPEHYHDESDMKLMREMRIKLPHLRSLCLPPKHGQSFVKSLLANRGRRS